MPTQTRTAVAQVRNLKERYAAMSDTIATLLSEILSRQNQISAELAALQTGLSAVRDVVQTSIDRLNNKSEVIDTHTIRLTHIEDRCSTHADRISRLDNIASDYHDSKQRLKGGWWMIVMGAVAGAGLIETVNHVLSLLRK